MTNKKESMAKHVDVENSLERDELASLLATELNKANKSSSEKTVYFLDERDDPSTITDWVSTGSTMLDLAISNRPYGGLPVGRLTTLTGLEGTSKSLMCAHIVANTQKKGGQAVYIDTEAAAAPEFWSSLGVNLKNMLYIPQDTIEGAFENIERIIGIVRKTNSDRLCTIILDSIAGASTKQELEQTYDRKGYATGKALIVSEAMRKLTNLIAKRRILLVCTNQLRQNLQAMAFGDKWCVDPYSTKVKIRYNTSKCIEEELSISEFAEKFLGINKFDATEQTYIDTSKLNIEILGKNLETGKDEYNKINKFVIKPHVNEYYTDGKLKGTDMHRIIENGKEIHLKDHPEFHKENGEMKVVDFEINKTHNYYANGRLNHNTEPCGKATSFHSSVKVRFEIIEKIKNTQKDVIGTTIRATVRKNRMGPPFRFAEYEIYFDSGIADYKSWIETAKRRGIITGPGNGLVYNGEKYNTNSLVDTINSNTEFKDKLYNDICNSVIMQYKTPNTVIPMDTVKENEGDEKIIEEDSKTEES